VSAEDRADRPTLVLVPGAWHGGWCWSRVVSGLRAAGVEAVALTLTGLGERAHLMASGIDVETHVRDIAAAIEAEELSEVALVGHSYAGVLLGAVAERMPARIRRLVYLDALVPARGETALELFPAGVADAIERAARAAGGEAVPPWPAASFGITDPDDRRWVDRHLSAHPFRTLAERGGAPPPPGLPRTFVACTERLRPTYLRFAEAARSDTRWDYREIACGHDAMVIAPGPLTGLLLEATRS
jgi:pimeloyl-ACP methyl ester carboxylesterase